VFVRSNKVERTIRWLFVSSFAVAVVLRRGAVQSALAGLVTEDRG